MRSDFLSTPSSRQATALAFTERREGENITCTIAFICITVTRLTILKNETINILMMRSAHVWQPQHHPRLLLCCAQAPDQDEHPQKKCNLKSARHEGTKSWLHRCFVTDDDLTDIGIILIQR